ncbi:MAG: PsiF family protein [Hyphomicrobiaceae bacterium]
MNRLTALFAIGALGLALNMPAALAQTTAPAAAPPPAAKTAAPKTAATVKKPRSAESLACSAEADKKGLHGKERKSFRAKCIKDARKAKGAASTKAKAPATPPAAKKN